MRRARSCSKASKAINGLDLAPNEGMEPNSCSIMHLPPPNMALEATGHSVHFVAGVGLYMWPAPQLGRSAFAAHTLDNLLSSAMIYLPSREGCQRKLVAS